MRARLSSALALTALMAVAGGAQGRPDAEYRAIGGGALRSVLPADGVAADATVAPYLLRSRLVTNGEFAAFVRSHPTWRRGGAPALFAAATYLSGWGDAADPAPLANDAPVVHVSWYAAQAYCASEGARLPRWYEWEFAAAADATRADARDVEAWLAGILNWYADAGKTAPCSVAAGTPNYYGIHDLHGLVWEWVEDYSGLFVNADSRAKGEQKLLDYCGGAAVSLADRRNYAILMRLALLSAMDGQQDGANLGFRCARDPLPPDKESTP
ncbi:MAG TPA: formylglycine-generating enzyme family protein [Duganella sp.]|uniref:formylglycine-generating enzyme family protein n=1 Tax=Duganella sp. TaxID=1904440 RepID=UPI002ED40F9E